MCGMKGPRRKARVWIGKGTEISAAGMADWGGDYLEMRLEK